LNTGTILVDRTHYLEALDLLEESKDILDRDGMYQTALYGDVLYALAETKIKGRLYQSFAAYYVKDALEDIQEANRIREKIGGILPQKLAQGYYLEGIIHKRFFMDKEKARSCFMKAVNIDPSFSAAKREWSDLIVGDRKE
jgi:tetratricopeptide (TPR) repeat protein